MAGRGDGAAGGAEQYARYKQYDYKAVRAGARLMSPTPAARGRVARGAGGGRERLSPVAPFRSPRRAARAQPPPPGGVVAAGSRRPRRAAGAADPAPARA